MNLTPGDLVKVTISFSFRFLHWFEAGPSFASVQGPAACKGETCLGEENLVKLELEVGRAGGQQQQGGGRLPVWEKQNLSSLSFTFVVPTNKQRKKREHKEDISRNCQENSRCTLAPFVVSTKQTNKQNKTRQSKWKDKQRQWAWVAPWPPSWFLLWWSTQERTCFFTLGSHTRMMFWLF